MAQGILLKTDRTATIVNLESYVDYDKYINMHSYNEYHLKENMLLLQAHDSRDINITASLLKLERRDDVIEIGGDELEPVFGNVLIVKSYLQGDVNLESLPVEIRDTIWEVKVEE